MQLCRLAKTTTGRYRRGLRWIARRYIFPPHSRGFGTCISFPPESAAYNITATIRFTGLLNKEALKRSIEAMAQRHESLRTTFRSVDGKPVQVIAPAVTIELPEKDLRAVPEELRLS